MWVTYNLSAKTTLPANTTVTVTLLGGGRNAKIYARPLGDTTTFRSEVGDAIDYYFFYGPTADEIIAGYRQATGDAPLFPEAAYGFWQCRERYSSQTQMLAAASQFRSRQIPVDYIVQDWQYWGNHGWGAYEWDLGAYPDPTNMIAELHTEPFQIHDFGLVQSQRHRRPGACGHAARADSSIANRHGWTFSIPPFAAFGGNTWTRRFTASARTPGGRTRPSRAMTGIPSTACKFTPVRPIVCAIPIRSLRARRLMKASAAQVRASGW